MGIHLLLFLHYIRDEAKKQYGFVEKRTGPPGMGDPARLL